MEKNKRTGHSKMLTPSCRSSKFIMGDEAWRGLLTAMRDADVAHSYVAHLTVCDADCFE